jgi:RND family efflux transporter MFP subunit
VHNAEAQVQVANITLNRIKTAQPGAAVSQQELDQAVAALKTAQATQEGAEAALRNSQLNLDWCRVVAPITGRVSSKLVTVGNLVTGGSTGQGTLLTTITSVDPIYLTIDADEASVLRYQRLAAEKKRVSARDQRIPCFMQLGNEHNFPRAGVVDFVNNQFDPFTGTLRARGVFPNPTGTLLPGMYATMRIAGSGRYEALLIPASAVQTQQNLKYVLTVDAKDTVHFTVVEPGALFGPLQAITSGIGPNDRIIVNGQLRARPDSQVEAKEEPIDPKLFEMTAPGSATTQELPATRPFEMPPAGQMPPMSTIVPPPSTGPSTRPATRP